MNHSKRSTLLSILVLLVISVFICQSCYSAVDYTHSYRLQTQGSKYYLKVAIGEPLYNAYKTQRYRNASILHQYGSVKFVTPQVFTQVASQLRQVFTDDADFANMVLQMVHQINYSTPCALKYPVETIVENSGDCDVFSVLAASIMVAGGLEVLLLEYPDHTNLGVYLRQDPLDGLGCSVEYNNKKFYIAETTGADAKVGENPIGYSNAKLRSLIPCDNSTLGYADASLMKSSSRFVHIFSVEALIFGSVTIVGVAVCAYSYRKHERKRLHR